MVGGQRVAFRTDASLQIGTGHVMRCLTLAHALREAGADCKFITRAHPGNMSERIQADGFEVSLLPAPEGPLPMRPPAHAHWAGVDWEQDAAETRAALGDAPDWLIMDHYAFDARWQRAALPTGTRLMIIDDLADRPHACDLLLDQNLGRNAADYDALVPHHCIRLIGPHYALLRPEFAAMRAQSVAERSGRGLRHILISMGGVDAQDATSQILDALSGADLPDNLRISVIMGAQAPALEKVRRKAQELPWPTEVLVDVSDMASRMAAADLAVGAGGATTWERCCLGLPSIIVQIADNQAGIAQALSATEAALDPDLPTAPDFVRKLRAALEHARNPTRLATLSRNASKLCRGDGTAQVLCHLMPNQADKRYSSRSAISEDVYRIWLWRNEGSSAQYYRTPKITPLHEHIEWFAKAMVDPERVMLIIELNKTPLGHVRLDRCANKRHHAEISIYIDPSFRGAGHGPCVLRTAIEEATFHGIVSFSAEAHEKNEASLKIFYSAGFKIFATNDGFVKMILDERDRVRE